MIDHFIISILVLVGLSLTGLPIGHSMILASIVYLWSAGLDMGTAAEQLLNAMYTSCTMLAIPLFVLAAEVMNSGSLTTPLLHFANALVGRFSGRLAQVNVLQSLLFASMSGSALADAAGMGKMVVKVMTEGPRYTASFAGALTAVTAVVAPILPPSIPMVLFTLVSNVSIGYLFIAGILPGLIITISRFLLSMELLPVAFLLVINALLLVLGALGIDRVHLSAILYDSLPFPFGLLAVLALITFSPDLVLYLLRMFGYAG